MLEKFIKHHGSSFTIQDIMDDIGHEVEKYRNLDKQGFVVDREIALLRMLKSDLRNICKRYERLESLLNHTQ